MSTSRLAFFESFPTLVTTLKILSTGHMLWLAYLRRWLSNIARLRTFNIVMATLLVASLYPVLAIGA